MKKEVRKDFNWGYGGMDELYAIGMRLQRKNEWYRLIKSFQLVGIIMFVILMVLTTVGTYLVYHPEGAAVQIQIEDWKRPLDYFIGAVVVAVLFVGGLKFLGDILEDNMLEDVATIMLFSEEYDFSLREASDAAQEAFTLVEHKGRLEA